MKKIIINTLCIAIITISSCSKFLDVQPKQTFGDNLAVSTLDGLANTTTGAFSKLQSGNLYGGGIISNSEFMADFLNTNAISDYSLVQFKSHGLNTYNSQVNGMWTDAYNAIMIVNTVLKYLPNFEAQDPATVKRIRGECYFIRGIMFYELVKMFAQPSGYTAGDSHLGIPLVFNPGTVYLEQSNPRATVAQTYAQIIADLKLAEQLLPTSNLRATKYAAEAFLAKAYFSQNKFTEAKNYSDLLTGGAFTFRDSANLIYKDLGSVPPAGDEAIFQIVNEIADIDNGSLYGRFGYVPYGLTQPIYFINKTTFGPYLVSAAADSDLRVLPLNSHGTPTATGNGIFSYKSGKYFCQKYNLQYANVTIVRLPEMYLISAECAAQQGNDADARKNLNKIRTRAGLPADHSSTGLGLVNTIRAERDLELAFEGDHFSEFKRRSALAGSGTFRCQDGNFAWNSPQMIYPIPQQEVDQNKSMVQNPGY